MTDPYDVLGVDRDADDEAIRRRYLELVRQHPPERAPERFAEIREAYDRLRDPIIHLETRLLDFHTTHTFEKLLADMKPDVRARRLPTEALLSLAKS
jgi:preprotein translocase subunit Sec63